MILTVRNPGQLRTNTNTYGERRKATGFRGLHLLLEPEELEALTGLRGLTEKPSVIMSLPAASLERARGVGASSYICCNTSFLGSRGKTAPLDEHLLWVGVFMDLGAGH